VAALALPVLALAAPQARVAAAGGGAPI
jgi:hypothetical protein